MRNIDYLGYIQQLNESCNTKLNGKKRKIQESAKYDFEGDVVDFEQIKKYWDENHDSDYSLMDYPNFESWFKDSKYNGYIQEIDEESYDKYNN